MGIHVLHQHYFDTITISADESVQIAAQKASSEAEINFYYGQGTIGISLDETTLPEDLDDIVMIFAKVFGKESKPSSVSDSSFHWGDLTRTTTFLEHPVFSGHHSESKMMRYIKSLENKDLSLVHSMISLGSCTMKLNAASEMFPVSWPEFANIHPFAPESQTLGYKQILMNYPLICAKLQDFRLVLFNPIQELRRVCRIIDHTLLSLCT